MTGSDTPCKMETISETFVSCERNAEKAHNPGYQQDNIYDKEIIRYFLINDKNLQKAYEDLAASFFPVTRFAKEFVVYSKFSTKLFINSFVLVICATTSGFLTAFRAAEIVFKSVSCVLNAERSAFILILRKNFTYFDPTKVLIEVKNLIWQ